MSRSRAPRTKDHIANAYREAGHAVAAWHLQVMLMAVSIFPNGRGAGRNAWNDAMRNVNFEWVGESDSTALAERLGAILLAGPVAQRKFADGARRGDAYKRRIQEARRVLLAASSDPADARARFDRLEKYLERFFARREVRDTTLTLGEQLLDYGTLTGARAQKVITTGLNDGS